MSAKYNITCEQAATFNFQFQIKNGTVPWDLTNYTGTMTVRPFIGSETTTLVASTANGRMTLNSSGFVTVTVDATTTGNIPAGRYVYDLILDSSGTVTRALEGKFVVTGAVTV
jgi:hypothetical protein